MCRSTPITVLDSPKPDKAWQRFAAVLCFLEAFYHFTVDGRWVSGFLGSLLSGIPSGCDLPWITMQLRPVVFVALGMALWNRHRSAHLLFWLAVAVCLAEIGAIWQHQMSLRGSMAAARGAKPFPISMMVRHVGEAALRETGWFALAAAGYWCHSRSRRETGEGRHPWVVCAGAWFSTQCMACVVLSVSGPWASAIIPLPRSLWLLQQYVTGALFAAAAAGLLFQWRQVRWMMLTCCLSAIAGCLFLDLRMYDFVFLTEGIRKGIPDWLRICMPGYVVSVGQWALATWFAFRVPMYRDADDGSPFPRVYCGNCHYNLHGLDTVRCPECGMHLQTAIRAPEAKKRCQDDLSAEYDLSG